MNNHRLFCSAATYRRYGRVSEGKRRQVAALHIALAICPSFARIARQKLSRTCNCTPIESREGESASFLLQSLTRGGESGLVAGLDFKSSGVHRKVGSVGSIPMHLRHLFSIICKKSSTGSETPRFWRFADFAHFYNILPTSWPHEVCGK